MTSNLKRVGGKVNDATSKIITKNNNKQPGSWDSCIKRVSTDESFLLEEIQSICFLAPVFFWKRC